MTQPKYIFGKQIRSISEFDQSECKYFRVKFGNRIQTKHRSFLISWQYRTLLNFIQRGWVYEAISDDYYHSLSPCYKCEKFKPCTDKFPIEDFDGTILYYTVPFFGECSITGAKDWDELKSSRRKERECQS